MDISSCGGFFPGTQGQVFLDAACVSLLPVQAEAALRRLGQDLLLCPARDASAHHIALDQTAGRARAEAARLIGSRPEEIALVESTTHALQIVAAAVPLGPGDKVLVGETEFLGLAIPWIPRQQRDGFHIEVIPSRGGRLLADDFARAADRHTRLILLSSVQWHNGFRADLEAFSALARERDIVLVVDAIQQLGAVPLDVGRTPIDALVCGGHKWLNAPVGRGFLYINPRRIEHWTPPAWGYLNVSAPPEGWATYFATPEITAVRSYEFVADARRFEVGGTANYPGNVALGASLALLNEIGPDAIYDHVVGLTDRLIEALQRHGLSLVSPPELGARSGIITFSLGVGPERDTACLRFLCERRVLISQRYTAGIGGLRVSSHLFNNNEDIDRLMEAVGDFQRAEG